MSEKTKTRNVSLGDIYSKFGVLMILLLALVVGTIISRDFLVPSNLLSVAQTVSIYGVLAVGMTRLLIGGGVDLSAGSNLAIASVLTALVYNGTGNTFLAIVAAIACSALVGAINGYFCSYVGLMPFIVTLATQMIVRGLGYLIAGGAPVYGVGSFIAYLGSGKVLGIPVLFLIALACALIMHFLLTRTSRGRYVYATGGNSEAARASGINVKKEIFLNYTIMGAICGLAGVLYAGRTNSGLPAGGVNFEFEAIIGTVLGGTSMAGGVGNVLCSIVGVFIVGIINNLMNLCSVNAYWQQIVKGVVILVAILLDIITRNSIMKSNKKA